MPFDFHVHGLWILGSLMLFVAAMLAGNVEWVEGTTPYSFGLTILIALVLFIVAGMCWISAAVNARQEMR